MKDKPIFASSVCCLNIITQLIALFSSKDEIQVVFPKFTFLDSGSYLNYFKIYFTCMRVFPVYVMWMLHVCLVSMEVRRGQTGTEVKGDCELLCGYWNMNLSVLSSPENYLDFRKDN